MRLRSVKGGTLYLLVMEVKLPPLGRIAEGVRLGGLSRREPRRNVHRETARAMMAQAVAILEPKQRRRP